MTEHWPPPPARAALPHRAVLLGGHLAIEAVPAMSKIGVAWTAPLLRSCRGIGTVVGILLVGLIAAKNSVVEKLA